MYFDFFLLDASYWLENILFINLLYEEPIPSLCDGSSIRHAISTQPGSPMPPCDALAQVEGTGEIN